MAYTLRHIYLTVAALALLSFPAVAQQEKAVDTLPVAMLVLQKGVFKGDCVLQEFGQEQHGEGVISADFNECKCTSDIRYPTLGWRYDLRGPYDNTPVGKLNIALKEAARGYMCYGESYSDQELQQDSSRGKKTTVTYEVLHQDASLISVKYFASFLGDGATGHWSAQYVVGDLKDGHVYTQNEVFDAKQADALNAYIREQLLRDAEISPQHRTELEKQNFITLPCDDKAADRSRSCRNWFIDKEGLKITFVKNEMTCGACGAPEIPIPSRFLAATPVRDYVIALETGKKPS